MALLDTNPFDLDGVSMDMNGNLTRVYPNRYPQDSSCSSARTDPSGQSVYVTSAGTGRPSMFDRAPRVHSISYESPYHNQSVEDVIEIFYRILMDARRGRGYFDSYEIRLDGMTLENILRVWEKVRDGKLWDTKYESLEQMGRLLTLPVPIGTKVYVIHQMGLNADGKMESQILERAFEASMVSQWNLSVHPTYEAARLRLESTGGLLKTAPTIETEF